MKTLRTPEELGNLKLNYYVAYSIAPSERDANKIGATMAQCKNIFTHGDQPEQRRLVELYAEAVEIMTNASSREEEFQTAKKLKLEAAEKVLAPTAQGSGVITKSSLIKIADRSNKWYTADELEKKIAHLLRSGARLVDDTQGNLDFFTYDKIEKKLTMIVKKDLYDLLGKTKNDAIASLQGAVTAVYNSVSGKTDPKSTNTNQVCGEAKKIFKDADSKKYYDAYLATKDIWEALAGIRAHGLSEIDQKQFLDFCQKAKAALKTNDANYVEILLREGLRNFSITVVGENTAAMEAELREKLQKEYDEKMAKKIKELEDKMKPVSPPPPPPIKQPPPQPKPYTPPPLPKQAYTPPPLSKQGYTPPPLPKK